MKELFKPNFKIENNDFSRKRKYIAKTFAVIILMTSSFTALAQKRIEDIAELKEKKWSRLVEGKYSYMNTLPLLEGLLNEELVKEENTPDPKEIGILTFQLWDESTWKSEKAGNWIFYEKHFVSEAGSNIISNKLLEKILPALKAQYSQAGLNLHEPEEYIDNEEERNAYVNGPQQVELSGITKFLTNGFFNRLQGKREGQGSVSADGYAFYPITPKLIASDFKSPASIGKITENLGLDASLIISVRVSIEKGGKLLVFRGMEMALVGPVDDEEEIEYKGVIGAKMMNMYRDGLMFSASYFELEKPIPLADLQKKTGEVKAWYIDGLDAVAERMTADMLFGLAKFVAMDKSKR